MYPHARCCASLAYVQALESQVTQLYELSQQAGVSHWGFFVSAGAGSTLSGPVMCTAEPVCATGPGKVKVNKE